MGYTIPVLPALDRAQRERFLKVYMAVMQEKRGDSDSDEEILDIPDLDPSSDDSDDDNLQAFIQHAIPMFAKNDGFDASDCTNDPVSISDFNDTECWLNFRFKKGDLYRLQRAFNVPAVMKTSQGHKFTGEEGLLIMLNRLAYPSRLSDLAPKFKRRPERLSELFRAMTDWLVNTYGHLLEDIKIWGPYMKPWSQALDNAECPIPGIWAFIDGTLRPLCRPGIFQGVLYSGHKRVHGIKFQSVEAPCGLIVHLFGPIAGHRHDSFMLRESRLLEQLEEYFSDKDVIFLIYGDPAYPISDFIITRFKGVNLTPAEKMLNKFMSSCREAVEWAFGKVLQYQAYLDFKKNLKILLSPVSNQHKAGVLVTNMHTCLYGCTSSRYFDCDPPTLEEYCAL
ncbi:hypothetical protein CYMTET_30946 [Cymbomonas tetramitiformis]|uniref:DDE Tnp4 domain-containing protein n=1 Tax=Cymbomonas tetramitiformis TaxID=36881 RepID=A0AAE0FIC9_9CHLO|nr:hypothetical protein CYMTET_30946 [Cymbomonas tetramitiformis]